MQLLRNERGIAMIVAIFAMVISIVIATEIAYESQVEYVGSSHSINRIKAYYAAKAGVELSLYRILLYKKAIAQYGDKLKENKSMLDPIWNFPFQWPPTAFGEMNAVDKGEIDDIVKESKMDAQYLSSIGSEGGKIDINDLGSEHKPLAEGAKKQLLQIFERKIEADKKFKDKYDDYDFVKLLNHVRDWVDEDDKSDTGDESLGYQQPENAKNFKLPPNAPFKTIAELNMVRDMEDSFFELLKDNITVFGTKGVNVNYCSKELLQSLDSQITDEVVQKILKRRDNPKEGGPFVDEKDFFNFLESIGVRTQELEKAKLPLLFDAEYNFRITSIGMSGNVRRQITVVTYDIDNLTGRYSEILDKTSAEKKGADQSKPPEDSKPSADNGTSATGTGGASPSANPKVKIPKGRPTIVFWQET